MQHIKKIYLYAVSLISLIMLVIASVILLNLALKTWVFTKADTNIYYAPPVMCDPANSADPAKCQDPNYKAEQEQAAKDDRTAQKQRDASQAVAMILVAAPVFYYHWRLARKEV